MKQVCTWILAAGMLLCMLLNGCSREEQPHLTDSTSPTQTSASTQQQTVTDDTEATQPNTTQTDSSADETEHTDPEDTKQEQTAGPEEPATEPTQGSSSNWESTTTTEGTVPMDGTLEKPQDAVLTVGETGRIRLNYSVNISSVKYVTSVSELPECEGLEAFDDAYFREHALLIVIETVSSGSVETGIESVAVDEDNAVVTLFHRAKNGVVTADMTTWLLWAEVDKGLDYHWTVANPAVESGTSKY